MGGYEDLEFELIVMEVLCEVEIMDVIVLFFFVFVYVVVIVVGFLIVGYFLGWMYKFGVVVFFVIFVVVVVVMFEKWRWCWEFLEVD